MIKIFVLTIISLSSSFALAKTPEEVCAKIYLNETVDPKTLKACVKKISELFSCPSPEVIASQLEQARKRAMLGYSSQVAQDLTDLRDRIYSCIHE